MPLSRKEAFRLGFLLRCAEDGLTPDQISGLTKRAVELKDLPGMLANFLWQAPLAAGTLAIGAGAGTGALLGHTAAKLTEPQIDPEEANRQELMAAYKQLADKARRQTARLQYRQPQHSRSRSSSMGTGSV